MNPTLSINLKDLETIFPFYILLNENMEIEKNGSSLHKIIDIENHPVKNINDFFLLERPHFNTITFDTLRSLNGQLIVLQSIDNPNLSLRAQPQFLSGEEKILIAGTPWFDSVEKLTSTGLGLGDFPAYTPQIELLHILRTQEIVNDELKELLKKSSKQKNELKEANDQIKLISRDLEIANYRYEYAIKATKEAIFDWNIITGEIYYGKEWNSIFGHLKTRADFTIEDNASRIHPEDIDHFNQHISEVIKSNLSEWEYEYRYLKSDGDYAMVVNRGTIIRDEKGKALRMIGLVKDITHNRKEEEHLRLLESVIKHTNDAVVITEATPNKPIIYVNDAFTKITGYTLNEVYGKNPKIFQGPNSSKEAVLKLKEAILNYTYCEVSTINYKKNGDEFWVNISMTPIADNNGNFTHWIAIERDISKQKESENEIIIQKKFTEDILNALPADIAVFDSNHRYLYINPHAIKNDEIRNWMIGKNDFDYAKMKGIDDALARKRREIFEHTISTRTSYEWVDKHNNGNNDNYVLRKFYPYFENNKLKFVIGYGIDITERKLIEIKLSEALEDIQKSNTELEQFAYVASHDLQEPLRMVTSFLTQLEKKYADNLDARAKEYIFYAVDGAKRMRQIILDLLEFSRVGKTEEKRNEIDICEIISEIKILHSKQIEETHAEIICHHLPTITSYKTPVRQIFQNLIGNALKYCKKDTTPSIHIKYEKKEDHWLFSVEDNGIGIDPQFHDKIFAIFQRLHNKEEYSGTGIGLAITKKIIENLGGKIWLTSELNNGSTFYFTLPF